MLRPNGGVWIEPNRPPIVSGVKQWVKSCLEKREV